MMRWPVLNVDRASSISNSMCVRASGTSSSGLQAVAELATQHVTSDELLIAAHRIARTQQSGPGRCGLAPTASLAAPQPAIPFPDTDPVGGGCSDLCSCARLLADRCRTSD